MKEWFLLSFADGVTPELIVEGRKPACDLMCSKAGGTPSQLPGSTPRQFGDFLEGRTALRPQTTLLRLNGWTLCSVEGPQ